MKIENISIASADRNLSATVFSPANAEHSPAVVFFQGYKGARSRYYEHARAVSEKFSATSLTVDISGHGESAGDLLELKRQDLYDDAAAAYDWLNGLPQVDSDRQGIVATSFGAHLAVILCRERNPKSLLLRAPSIKEDLPTVPDLDESNEQSKRPLAGLFRWPSRAPTIYEVMEKALKERQADDRLRSILPSEGLLKIIHDYTGRITIVESEKDDHIERKHIDACLAVAQHATLRVIKGAGHVLNEKEKRIYRTMILDWANQL